MTPLVLWVPVLLLAVLVVWSIGEGLVLAPRRARRRFDALAEALGLPVVEEPDGSRRLELGGGIRPLTLRAVHRGGDVRGETGRLCLIETALRVSRWEMHDVQIRQRRRAVRDGGDRPQRHAGAGPAVHVQGRRV